MILHIDWTSLIEDKIPKGKNWPAKRRQPMGMRVYLNLPDEFQKRLKEGDGPVFFEGFRVYMDEGYRYYCKHAELDQAMCFFLDKYICHITFHTEFSCEPKRETGDYSTRYPGTKTVSAVLDVVFANPIRYSLKMTGYGNYWDIMTDLYKKIRRGLVKPRHSYEEEQVQPKANDFPCKAELIALFKRAEMHNCVGIIKASTNGAEALESLLLVDVITSKLFARLQKWLKAKDWKIHRAWRMKSLTRPGRRRESKIILQ